MTTLSVSAVGLDEVKRQFAAMPEQIRLAQRRAIARTATHVAANVRKGMAAAVGARPAKIKSRVTSRMLRDMGLVWIGLNPLLPIHLAGGISQGKAGVTAGGRLYRGAFYRSVYGGQRKVWIRLRSRFYDAETYPYQRRNQANTLPSKLRSRFPVVLARVPLDTAAVRAVYEREADEAGPYLVDLLARELAFRAGRA